MSSAGVLKRRRIEPNQYKLGLVTINTKLVVALGYEGRDAIYLPCEKH